MLYHAKTGIRKQFRTQIIICREHKILLHKESLKYLISNVYVFLDGSIIHS